MPLACPSPCVAQFSNEKAITDLQRQIKWAVDNVTYMTGPKGQTASPYDLTDYHARAMRLLQSNSINTMGQNVHYPSSKTCTTNNVTVLNGTDEAAKQTATCKAAKLVPTGYPTVNLTGQY